ncbi:hypothetical protein JTB14_023055 [Gonioctena quinquepunctata]|nr:hypothetical protein JTB14_023055 [Gonioctena quinquepunctata]
MTKRNSYEPQENAASVRPLQETAASCSYWDAIDFLVSKDSEDLDKPTPIKKNQSDTDTSYTQGEQALKFFKTDGKKKTKQDQEFREIVDIAKTIASKIKTPINNKNHMFAKYVEETLNTLEEQDEKELRKKNCFNYRC